MDVVSFVFAAIATFPSLGIMYGPPPQALMAQAPTYDINYGLGGTVLCTKPDQPDKYVKGCNATTNTLFTVEVDPKSIGTPCRREIVATTKLHEGLTPEQEAATPSEIMYCNLPSDERCQRIICKPNLQANVDKIAGIQDTGANSQSPTSNTSWSVSGGMPQGSLTSTDLSAVWAQNTQSFGNATVNALSIGQSANTQMSANDQIVTIANGPQSSAAPTSLFEPAQVGAQQMQTGTTLQFGNSVALSGAQPSSQFPIGSRLAAPITGFQWSATVSDTPQTSLWQRVVSFFFK
jgi:hypothetical protein